MRLTDWALLWTIIFVPLQMSVEWGIERQIEQQQSKLFYEHALQRSLDDATWQWELSNRSGEAAISQFFRTLQRFHPNYERAHLERIVPFLIMMENDGYMIYTLRTTRNAEGTIVQNMKQSAKQHFVGFDDRGHTLRLRLDDRLDVYSKDKKRHDSGNRAQLYQMKRLPMLRTDEVYANWKRHVILTQLEADLEKTVQSQVRFAFPRSAVAGRNDAEYGNPVDGEGLLACMQIQHYGLPDGNPFVFASTKLSPSPPIIGFTWKGQRFYQYVKCVPKSAVVETRFTRPWEAAAAGYSPLQSQFSNERCAN